MKLNDLCLTADTANWSFLSHDLERHSTFHLFSLITVWDFKYTVDKFTEYLNKHGVEKKNRIWSCREVDYHGYTVYELNCEFWLSRFAIFNQPVRPDSVPWFGKLE